MASCNAEGCFVPPAWIFKEKNKEGKEWEDWSKVYMSKESGYVNSTKLSCMCGYRRGLDW
jgi:hypothetical protein